MGRMVPLTINPTTRAMMIIKIGSSKVKACQSNIEMLTKAAEMYKEVKGDTAQLTVKTLLDAEYINEYVYCPVDGFTKYNISGETVSCGNSNHAQVDP
jgi:hypothetical protein